MNCEATDIKSTHTSNFVMVGGYNGQYNKPAEKYKPFNPQDGTFKNFGVIQTNHMGVIDNSYNGDNDQWMFPAYAERDTIINKNDRICQFRIIKSQPKLNFVDSTLENNADRGGFGSTGIK